jgi:hypothetical protein
LSSGDKDSANGSSRKLIFYQQQQNNLGYTRPTENPVNPESRPSIPAGNHLLLQGSNITVRAPPGALSVGKENLDMNKFKNPMMAAAVLTALGLIGSMMNSHPSVLQAAGGPTVTIDPSQLPLHVTGTTTVSGTVGITGNTAATPLFVRAADTTTLLVENSTLASTSTSGGNQSLHLDTSAAKTIRLNANLGSCGPCSPVRFDVYSNNSLLIDQFTITPNVGQDPAAYASRVYEVPGTSLSVFVSNTQAGAQNFPRVTVAARTN